MRRTLLGAGLAALVAVPLLLVAQQGRGGRNDGGMMEPLPNVQYDGRFTFARIMYSSISEFGGFRRRLPEWAHDYPHAEFNFTKILGELSAVRTRLDGSVVLTLDDPDLLRFPVSYMAEPGFWRPSEAEVLGLRNYLLKGGFLILDDFDNRDWINMEAQMRRVLPEARLLRVPLDHPVFDTFYQITDFAGYIHPYSGAQSEFWGVFEDNDPYGRLLVAINYRADIAEYWEFADTGFFPIDLSNESFKLGVNYIIYALTR